jgi:DNA-directed RNA polymerase subunit omega
MARITVEDCLNKVNNRFALIHMAAKRVRQLRKGAEPLVVSKNRDVVVSLREIAAGKVSKVENLQQDNLIEDKVDILAEELEVEKDAESPDEEKGEKAVPEGK